MREYLKNDDISIKRGSDVNTIMWEMMSVILEAVLDEELVYFKYDYRNKETDNSRNGDIAIPRDRNGWLWAWTD